MPKKKLTPAEKEKKKKEEAERKLKAEEEAKLKAEAEEAERIKQELIAEEKFWAAEYEERKVRWVEFPELENMWNNERQQLRTLQSERSKLAKWARYMKCDGLPDPTVPKEINMFISLWKEDKADSSYDEIIEATQLVHQLIGELEDILQDNLDESLTEIKRKSYTETLNNLQDLLATELDLATHDLLCRASKMADIDTMNLEKIIKTDLVTLGIWGNISKNPRIKSYEFGEMGVHIELPKLLTLSDIALRVMFTKYDHVSHQSRSYHLKPHHKFLPVEAEVDLERLDLLGGDEGSEEGGEHDNNEGGAAPETTDDIRDALKQLAVAEHHEDDEEKHAEKSVEDENAVEKMEDWNIPTPEPMDFEEFLEEDLENSVNLRAFNVIGGIIYFNLLLLPPQPKEINHWTITQLIDPPHLRHMDYRVDVTSSEPQQLEEADPAAEPHEPAAEPHEPAAADQQQQQQDGELSHTAAAATKATDETDSVAEENEEEHVSDNASVHSAAGSASGAKKELDKTPVQVTMKLPTNVLICEEPQIVRWDETGKNWKTDGFIDKVYNEEERTLTFKMCQFGTMALLQDAYINMPFQAWELRSRGLNQAQLSITAAISLVEIQIKDDLVCLTQPAEKQELSYLLNQWMKLPNLIKHMKYSGLNVFPEQDSNKYVKVLEKNAAAEDRLYRQMADVASCMSFCWSRWNFEVHNEKKIIIQGAEQLTDEPVVEEDWSLFLITKNRAEKLGIDELSEEYSDERAEGTVYHTNMYHMAMDLLSNEGKRRMTETSPVFRENVYQLLRRTRLVTHS